MTAKWAGLAVALVLAVFAGAPQADCEWQKLGERTVDHRQDHDSISVTRSEGTFNTVQLRVKGARVDFDKVTVVFANGGQQELDMREEVPAGGTTRAIDLQGETRDRTIRRVDFDYRTEGAGERAVVELWGVT